MKIVFPISKQRKTIVVSLEKEINNPCFRLKQMVLYSRIQLLCKRQTSEHLKRKKEHYKT